MTKCEKLVTSQTNPLTSATPVIATLTSEIWIVIEINALTWKLFLCFMPKSVFALVILEWILKFTDQSSNIHSLLIPSGRKLKQLLFCPIKFVPQSDNWMQYCFCREEYMRDAPKFVKIKIIHSHSVWVNYWWWPMIRTQLFKISVEIRFAGYISTD